MAVPETEESKRSETPWSKSWIFVLAFLCILSLSGLGFWGRVRMLEDDRTKLEKTLETEMMVHEHEEEQLRNSLRQKNRKFDNLQQEMVVATRHFQQLNTSLKTAKSHYADLKTQVMDVKEHSDESMQKAREEPSQFLSECHGVALPAGYEYTPKDHLIFPHDLAADASGLHALLTANASFLSLFNVTSRAMASGLFTQPTSFPWAQYTWLQALFERPDLKGTFTEFGVGKGGSMMFLAAVARLRGSFAAGFDVWDTPEEALRHTRQFAEAAEQVGVSIPQEAVLFDLRSSNLSAQLSAQLGSVQSADSVAFTHIDIDDYDTTLGILKNAYPMTVDGGILAVENFLHASGGTKRAVEDYFKSSESGEMPVIYPVFPGSSVLIFKGVFAGDTDTPNALDGNHYNLKYIKGQPELFESVNRSMALLSDTHREVKADPQASPMSICWLSLALHSVQGLRDFILSADERIENFEAADIFRFIAVSSGASPVTDMPTADTKAAAMARPFVDDANAADTLPVVETDVPTIAADAADDASSALDDVPLADVPTIEAENDTQVAY